MNKKKIRDLMGEVMSWLASSITIAACLGIIIYLFNMGHAQIDIGFLTNEPATTLETEKNGILTPLVGTLLLTFIGTLVAFPWALGTAIYLSEYAKRNNLTETFRLGIDVLSGVPTIVVAIFGLAVFSNPALGFLSSMVEGVQDVNRAFGRSFLVSGITMAVMILPFVIKTCEEALKSVPDTYREASLAMGASKWYTITKVILPTAKNGIITAVILGMGRIIGDTAIVWLTLGGTLRMTGVQPWWRPDNWLSTLKNTGSTLTSYIYFMSPAGEGHQNENAFGAAFVLIIIIILLNLLTDFFMGSKEIGK
ncbi:MAG: phosphate ABC transporter permease PstA [Clostridia bacterium]|nr:phosphate ABC transporter permease PstA [Clostridia bacterium]